MILFVLEFSDSKQNLGDWLQCHLAYTRLCPFRNASISTNAAVNGYLELTFLNGCQRFDAISTSNLEVYKFWDR